MFAGFLAFLGAIFLIVLVHEAGHFVVARWAGMPASVFSVGFGRRLFGVRWRGTDFRLSMIPLGGYVRVDPMEETVEGPRGSTTRFDSWPMSHRVAVVVAGVAMNLVLAAGIYLALPMIWGVEASPELRVAAVRAEALPPGSEGWSDLPADAPVTAVDGRPVSDWQGLLLALVGTADGDARLRLADGSTRTVGVPAADADRVKLLEALVRGSPALVGRVEEEGDAMLAGFRAGDRVVAVGGSAVATWESFRRRLQAAEGSTAAVTVVREGRSVELSLPIVERPGLARGSDRRRPGPVGATKDAVRSFRSTMALIGESWSILLTGRISPRQLSGPVAVAEASARIFMSGWESFLRFVAFLSVNIAVVNILPIPALDGGYLAMMGVERVRRRPLTAPVQAYLARVGMIWLILVMASTVVNDLMRLAAR